MGWTHTIALQLEIMPGNKILVPGCEPTSSISSRVLSSYMARNGCGSALVDVEVALAAIPGSFIKFGANFNRGGYRQKWFVLPPLKPECPQGTHPDYFKMLKELASTELPVEESYDKCHTNSMGYCPHPDFQLTDAPPVNPYTPEGSFPAEGGVLPPLPNWAS